MFYASNEKFLLLFNYEFSFPAGSFLCLPFFAGQLALCGLILASVINSLLLWLR